MKSVSSHGCLRGFGVGVLVAAAVVDVLDTGAAGHSVWPVALVLLTGLTAVLWSAARRPPWLTPELRAAVPGVLSALLTVGSLVSGARYLFGPGEVMVLLCLLFIAVRHCSPRWVVACGLLDALALLATPVRYAGSLSDDNALAFIAIGLVLVGLTAGLASYLRSLDYRRTVAVGETRRAERLAIAADLHDFVAHHVTGILVQTQVARMMAATGSGELDPVLAGIERAATEALASMRRTVGVLRDTGPEPDRRPVGDLAAITELTDGFPAPGQKVTLDRAPGLDTEVPHEVQAAAFRVVQEALTNVRRHAGDATDIAVTLYRAGDRLEVTVSDDGHGSARLPDAAHGGGFGLVGLTERVTALGGTLDAGPRAAGGWTVRALFPLGKG
ncbi:sensor histidine kinase [Streptomyces sp. NPDC051016]|uniref:sensor histidine kinase n=1 Tax=Streptomyces sp. NPDC051016 TaxID=3365638 RepID=UPI00378FFAC4